MNEITEGFKQVSDSLSKLGILVEKVIAEKQNEIIISKRFVDNMDGVITDLQTGLTWVRDPITVLGSHREHFTWNEAISMCNALSFAKIKCWRLPTIQEELSIVDYMYGGGRGLAINNDIFKNMKPCYYWTSTPCAWSEKDAWVVDIKNGYSFIDNKSFTHPIHPVCSTTIWTG